MMRPKKNTSEKCIIIDLSYPKGHIVNTGIKKGYYLGKVFNFLLPTIATLADGLLIAGAGSWFWTSDLSPAEGLPIVSASTRDHGTRSDLC